MSSNCGAKIKRKKSKLDRLLLIKKNIMDSLNLLSKQNKAPASAEKRSNTVPKRHTRPGSKGANRNEQFRACMSDLPRHFSRNYADQIRVPCDTPLCPREEGHDPACNQVQANYQTWPRDEYFLRPFEDQYSFITPDNRETLPSRPAVYPPINVQVYTLQSETDNEPAQVCQLPHNRPLVRHQAIQTEEEPAPRDVNADIIRYLNQCNDKAAFNLHAPSHLRKSSFFPCYGGFNERTPRGYPNYLAARQPHAPSMGYKSLGVQYYHPYVHTRLQYDRVRLPLREQSPSRSGERAQLAQFQTSAPTVPTDQHLLAPACPDTRISSQDSSSRLSSETDSDFVFFPCTSLAQNFQDMSLMDSSTASILSPPSDLPDVNTNLSWRSDLYGSSLDDVTFQFFLDEDALSDDVFVDDSIISGNGAAGSQELTMTLNNDKPSFCSTNPQLSPTLNSPNRPSPSSDFQGGYSDNCYTYRYADIDEVLHTIAQCSTEHQPTSPASSHADKCSPGVDGSGSTRSYAESDVQSPDDYHLELNPEFANVFDSLRRNSTQTKARQMWRQRRARSNKKAANSNKGKQLSHYNKPAIFTFDKVDQNDSTPSHNSPRAPEKPLRGILKNNKSPLKLTQDPSTNCYETILATDTGTSLVYSQGAELKSPIDSPRTLPFSSRRVSPTIIISYVNKVVVSLNGHQSNSAVECEYSARMKVKSPGHNPENFSPDRDFARSVTKIGLQISPDHEVLQAAVESQANSISGSDQLIDSGHDVSTAEFNPDYDGNETTDVSSTNCDKMYEDASQQAEGNRGYGDVQQQTRGYGDVSQKKGSQGNISQQTDGSGDIIQQIEDRGDISQQVTGCGDSHLTEDYGDVNQRKEDHRYVSQQVEGNEYVSHQMEDRGYVSQQIEDNGHVSQQIKDNGYVSQQIENNGYVSQQIDNNGYVSQQVEDNEYVSQQMEDRGYVNQQIEDNEYVSQQMEDNGYVSQQVEDRGYVNQQVGDFGDVSQQTDGYEKVSLQMESSETVSRRADVSKDINLQMENYEDVIVIREAGDYKDISHQREGCEDVSEPDQDRKDVNQEVSGYGYISHEIDGHRDVSQQDCVDDHQHVTNPQTDTVDINIHDFVNISDQEIILDLTHDQLLPRNVSSSGSMLYDISAMDEDHPCHRVLLDNNIDSSVALVLESGRSTKGAAENVIQNTETFDGYHGWRGLKQPELDSSGDVKRTEDCNVAVQGETCPGKRERHYITNQDCPDGSVTTATHIHIDDEIVDQGIWVIMPVTVVREGQYVGSVDDINLTPADNKGGSHAVITKGQVTQKTVEVTMDLGPNPLDSERANDTPTNAAGEDQEVCGSTGTTGLISSDTNGESVAENNWTTEGSNIRTNVSHSDSLMTDVGLNPDCGCSRRLTGHQSIVSNTDRTGDDQSAQNLRGVSHEFLAVIGTLKHDHHTQDSTPANRQLLACSTNSGRDDVDARSSLSINHQCPARANNETDAKVMPKSIHADQLVFAASSHKEMDDDGLQRPPYTNHQEPVASTDIEKENGLFENNSDQSRVNPLPADQSDQRVVAARKDSLEVHRWSHSARRRHKLHARKAKRSSVNYQPQRQFTEPFNNGLSVFHGCKLTAATL